MRGIVEGLIVRVEVIQRFIDSLNTVSGTVSFIWLEEKRAGVSSRSESIDEEQKDVKEGERDEEEPLLPGEESHLAVSIFGGGGIAPQNSMAGRVQYKRRGRGRGGEDSKIWRALVRFDSVEEFLQSHL